MWYSGLFVLCMLGMFAVAYWLLQDAVARRDHTVIRTQLREYAHYYGRGGLAAVKARLAEEAANTGARAMFMRIATADNTSLFSAHPRTMNRFDLAQLEQRPASSTDDWIEIPEREDDEDVLEVATTRLPDGGVLQLGSSTSNREEFLEHFSDLFCAFAVFATGLGIGAGRLVAKRTLRPLQSLAAVVETIASTGDIKARVPTYGTGDELDRLSALFNTMLGRIGRLLTGMQESLDNVAHDLRTPLTRLRGTAELALQIDHPAAVQHDALVNCVEQSDHILATLNTLLTVAEAEAGALKLKLEAVDLGALIAQTADLYREVAEDKRIALVFNGTTSVMVQADRVRLRQILANALDNALKYTPPYGRVTLEAATQDKHAMLAVTDSGPGFAVDEIERVFDRLYRGDHSRSQPGLGLGLSLVRAIVYAHGGTIAATNVPPHGARLTILLPLQRAI